MSGLDERIVVRNQVADAYHAALASIPGISFPDVPEHDRSTYKDFTVLIDADEFGISALQLSQLLAHEGIDTRRYYSPPVHTMRAYRYLSGVNGSLSVTQRVSDQVLTLPLWGGMTDSDVLGVADAISRIHGYVPRGGVEGRAQ
jgi:dTDP-4-amino-4,6-dideoxygalactose transaminase